MNYFENPGVLFQFKTRAAYYKRILYDEKNAEQLEKNLSTVRIQKFDENAGIYGILNKETRDMYIGSTISIHNRITEHYRGLKNGKTINILMDRAVKKYDPTTFEFILIQYVRDNKELADFENFWIAELDPPYNMKRKARRFEMSEDHKRKIGHWSKNVRSKDPYCAPVYQLDDNLEIIKEYPSLNAAKEALNIVSGHISTACRTGNKAYGFYWRYKHGWTQSRPRKPKYKYP